MKTGMAVVALLASAILYAGTCPASDGWHYEVMWGTQFSSCPILQTQTSDTGVFPALCTQQSHDEKARDEYTVFICVQAGVLDAAWRSWVVSGGLSAADELAIDQKAQDFPMAVWVTVVQNITRRPLVDLNPACDEVQGSSLSDWSGSPLLYSDGALYILSGDTREVSFSFKLAMAVAGCDSWNDGGGDGDSLVTIRCWADSESSP
jgi:hypothetical protein